MDWPERVEEGSSVMLTYSLLNKHLPQN